MFAQISVIQSFGDARSPSTLDSLVLGEESFADLGQLRFEDLIETILECVRANDALSVSEQDNTAASTSILHREELVLDHFQGAVVLTRRLSQHNVVIFAFALAEHSFDEVDFIFAHHELDFVFQELDHSLHNKRNASMHRLFRVVPADLPG